LKRIHAQTETLSTRVATPLGRLMRDVNQTLKMQIEVDEAYEDVDIDALIGRSDSNHPLNERSAVKDGGVSVLNADSSYKHPSDQLDKRGSSSAHTVLSTQREDEFQGKSQIQHSDAKTKSLENAPSQVSGKHASARIASLESAASMTPAKSEVFNFSFPTKCNTPAHKMTTSFLSTPSTVELRSTSNPTAPIEGADGYERVEVEREEIQQHALDDAMKRRKNPAPSLFAIPLRNTPSSVTQERDALSENMMPNASLETQSLFPPPTHTNASRAHRRESIKIANSVDPILEQAHQMSHASLLGQTAEQNNAEQSALGQVQNTFNVNVSVNKDNNGQSETSAELQDALTELLRTAARRQGLEV